MHQPVYPALILYIFIIFLISVKNSIVFYYNFVLSYCIDILSTELQSVVWSIKYPNGKVRIFFIYDHGLTGTHAYRVPGIRITKSDQIT